MGALLVPACNVPSISLIARTLAPSLLDQMGSRSAGGYIQDSHTYTPYKYTRDSMLLYKRLLSSPD